MKRLIGGIIIGLILGLVGVLGASEEVKYTFYFVTHMGPSDPNTNWYFAGFEPLEELLPIKVIYSAPEVFSIEKQRELIEAAIAARPDGLIVSITDPVAFEEPLRRAIAEGLPVIAVNIPDTRPPEERIPYLTYIGDDEYLTGYKMAERLLAEAQKRGIEVDAAACVIHHVGHVGIEARAKGFGDYLEENVPGAQYYKVAAGEDPTIIYEATRSILEAHPEIDLVYAPAGWASPWAYKAIMELGLEDRVLLATADASPFSLEGILMGRVICTHSQQFFLQGWLPVMWMYLINEYGYYPPPEIITGPVVVDASNVQVWKQKVMHVFGPETYEELSIWPF